MVLALARYVARPLFKAVRATVRGEGSEHIRHRH